jgi:hypothetical protein
MQSWLLPPSFRRQEQCPFVAVQNCPPVAPLQQPLGEGQPFVVKRFELSSPAVLVPTMLQ